MANGVNLVELTILLHIDEEAVHEIDVVLFLTRGPT